MKKLMFALVAAGAAAVMADGIESQNVVGYQLIPIRSGVLLFTPTFQGAGDVNLDLTSIEVCDAEGNVISDCINDIGLQKMSTNNGYYEDEVYSYRSGTRKWNLDGSKLDAGDVTFRNGEGIAVMNDYGETVYFRVSGEVDFVCENIINTGVSLWGNPSPSPLDLTNVEVCDLNGDVLTDCINDIGLQKMSTNNGYYEDEVYSYRSGARKWNLDGTKLDSGDVTLSPGEGIAVMNDYGEEVMFKYTLPSSN